jgi:sterol desaturase/sphingolipid hydroxylase (fatty acid hydroxylase superfamily)
MSNILAKISYPGVLFITIVLHLYVVDGQPLIVATYVPVLFGVLAVTLLEIFTPERTAWHPQGSDIGNDAAYMVAIQILLPRLLAFLFALGLIGPLRSSGWILENYWPHQWPVGFQVIAMILVADFFRYWLHRFAHEYGFLWRFHAVHHSVPKLYWLNVGRFHYVDKSLQFLFDALPFILLGVSEGVLALYFVFYSVNGFFQHSNIRLHLGFLNYVFSTAELHRWHHSRITAESNTNYGNNIILWDILFGTWFLPRDRKVDELGLHNTHYPYSFIDQLKTPYIDGINERDTAVLTYGEILRNWLIKAGMLYNRYCLWLPLEKAASDPRKAQLSLLRRILADYKSTRFGQRHAFDDIAGYEGYVEWVPVQTYEDLRPLIEAQQATGEAELTPRTPRMYALTSGTTGRPKMLPVLDQTLRQQRRMQRIFSYLQYRRMPDAFSGKMLGVMGAPVEGRLDNGVPYGSVSGFLYLNMPRIMHGKYVVPTAVFDIMS